MIALFSALLGFFSSATPDLLKLFRDGKDRAHEITLLQLQMEYQREQLRLGAQEADAARVERLRPWLAPSLSEAFRRWFGRPARPDEAPQLNGDPFTDTQEPPLALALVFATKIGVVIALCSALVAVIAGVRGELAITGRLTLAGALVSLYQALGGGWEPRMERSGNAL